MNLFQRAVSYYREHGFLALLFQGPNYVFRTWLLPFFAGLYTQLSPPSDERLLLIKLRSNGFDAASISLLSQLESKAEDSTTFEKVVLAVDSKDEFQKKSEPVQFFLNDLKLSFTVREIGTFRFVDSFQKADTVIITSITDLWRYRLLAGSNKLLVHIYHGIITKSYGNLETQKNRVTSGSTNIDIYPYGLASRFDRLDVKSISSDVEQHFKTAAEARQPNIFQKWGYPRHDRMNQLAEDPDTERILPQNTKKILEKDNSSTKLLYAPTHYDGADVHPFRLPDFEFDEFTEVLKKHDVTLYMRMHYSEESNENYKKYLSHERIKYAGYSFSPSPVEMLDYFDVLITDYSSMYVDALRYDMPVLFIRGLHEEFLANRGLSFEEDVFFPGPKIHDFEELLGEISKTSNGTGEFTNDREIVNRVLLPETDYSFLDCVKNETKQIINQNQ